MLKTYVALTKPGIIVGNVVTATAGFFLASRGEFDFGLYLAAIGGLSLVIASACVFNNHIDRSIDAKMVRTKNRALVRRVVTAKAALIYGSILGLAGFAALGLFANLLSALVALIGFFFYVVMYSIWKRRSVYSTIIGSVAGAVPPVVGYTAVSNDFDAAAAILFAILVFWQMPHFYAIGIYRRKEYAAAGIPILPVKSGIWITKINILFFIIAFTASTSLLSLFGYTSYVYMLVAAALGLYWLGVGIQGFRLTNSRQWARKMFGVSLLVITMISITISVDAWLP